MRQPSPKRASEDHRRELVARYHVRGLSQREIVAALHAEGCDNPLTGAAWDLATVHRDLRALSAIWQRYEAVPAAEHRARQLAELGEVRRAAWVGDDLDKVLRALKQESDLTGTAAPVKVAPTTPDGQAITITTISIMPPAAPSGEDADGGAL